MQRLRQIRMSRGLTQEALANMLGVRRLTVLRWENGETNPDIPTLQALAAALETTVGALLGEMPASTDGAA